MANNFSVGVTLRHQAYILMTQLLSQNEIEKLAYSPYAPDPINSLLGEYADELDERIITFAALARAYDDARGGLNYHLQDVPAGVGTVTMAGVGQALTAREACNKIIHSNKASLKFQTSSDHPLYADKYIHTGISDNKTYSVPILELEGELHGKPWKASINLIQWIMAVVNYCKI